MTFELWYDPPCSLASKRKTCTFRCLAPKSHLAACSCENDGIYLQEQSTFSSHKDKCPCLLLFNVVYHSCYLFSLDEAQLLPSGTEERSYFSQGHYFLWRTNALRQKQTNKKTQFSFSQYPNLLLALVDTLAWDDFTSRKGFTYWLMPYGSAT